MLRFTTKDVLRGMTLVAVGFGMLAIVLNETFQATSKEPTLLRASLIAFGGLLIGLGFAFPFKYPPIRFMLGMIGMLAASSWFEGSYVGLALSVILFAPFAFFLYMMQPGQSK